MAVYTQLTLADIAALVAPLGLGHLAGAEGVTAGVENTTYFLTFAPREGAQKPSKYVLTIAESLNRADLDFVATLMYRLGRRGLPVPAPAFSGCHFEAANAVLDVCGKPAMVVNRVDGSHPTASGPSLCTEVGQLLAQLHHATLELGYRHESHRSLEWVAATGHALLPHLPEPDRELMVEELATLQRFVNTNSGLPTAIIHADLFRDNVLIRERAIVALIDFFSAGTGYLLFDLAVVVNDWCFNEQAEFDPARYYALITAYAKTRPFTEREKNCWGELLRLAALRFWVSRLGEKHLIHANAPRGRGKDPAQYRRLILRHRIAPLDLNPQ